MIFGKITCYRSVAISQDAIEVLKVQKRKTHDEYVFPSPTGGPISPDSVNNMLHRVLKRAGIPKVRFHDLRHTFATLDAYAHMTTAAQKEAANTIGNVLKGNEI